MAKKKKKVKAYSPEGKYKWLYERLEEGKRPYERVNTGWHDSTNINSRRKRRKK